MEAIIDIEIANRMSRENWDNRKADINCIGALLIENKQIASFIQIIRTKDMTKETFAKAITDLLNPLRAQGCKLWALNAPFETEAIQAYTGELYDFLEVRHGLHGRLSGKEALYGYLLDKGLCMHISDPYNGDSGMVQGSYDEYLRTDAWAALQEILAHNINCLIKEFFILKNIDFILKNAQTDSRGYIEKLR